jgi:hypothetical protein
MGEPWRQDSGNAVDSCPCCGLIKLYDKEPDYDDNQKYNKGEETRFSSQVAHLRALNSNKRSDPLVDKDGKQFKKVENPRTKPQLLRCNQGQNYESVSATGQKCYFQCKYEGIQYDHGTCPSCKSSCDFVWDRLKHDEIRQYFEMKRVTDGTTTTEREEANEYLDNMCRYENGEKTDFEVALQELDDNDVIDVADDVIAEVAKERGAFAAAQHMIHNPAGVGATSLFQNVIAMGSHRNGQSWSIPYNKDMRLHDASSQR